PALFPARERGFPRAARRALGKLDPVAARDVLEKTAQEAEKRLLEGGRFSVSIANLRHMLGKTRRDVARASGLGVSTVARVAQPQSTPLLSTLDRCLRGLGLAFFPLALLPGRPTARIGGIAGEDPCAPLSLGRDQRSVERAMAYLPARAHGLVME